MEKDDDTFIIIVGDSVIPAPLEIKQEVLDEDTKSNVHTLESGVYIKNSLSDLDELTNEGSTIKEEPLDYEESNGIENKSFEVSIVKDEQIECDGSNDLLNQNEPNDDNEYYPDIEVLTEWSSDEEDDNVIQIMNKRTRLIKSRHRKSYVKALTKSYPELKRDKDLLIDCIVAVMKSTKPPPLPLDYYVMNGIMLDTTNLYKHEKRCDAPDAITVLKARAMHLGCKGRSRPFLVKFPVKEPKRFNCTQCSASFMAKVSLVAHQHMHSGVRPYACPLCPHAYTSNTTLARHVKKHSDERFICDHCQKSFNAKTTLVAHLDTHRPLKRFACTECGKRYAQRAALGLHVRRTHRGLPPPAACRLCPKRYPRMSILKNHMKKVHGMMLITRKMFFKSLPTLSNAQVQQAKVVMTSEVEDHINYYRGNSAAKGRS